MKDRLIVALDLPDANAASEMVERLDGAVSFFKLGWSLFLDPSFSALLGALVDRGKRVFLDAKLFDVPSVVCRGVTWAAERSVSFITVRGDPTIVRTAVEASRDSKTHVLAVVTLTSADALEVTQGLAPCFEAGCDGMIAAPSDLRYLHRPAPEFLFVTPGVRLPGDALDDHHRFGTPSEAIRNGADYVVVGRPIINAPDPAAAAARYLADMERGSSS